MGVSGPYGETSRGNKYRVSFVAWLTDWQEAFAVPEKKAQTVAELQLTEITPRCGIPLELVSDNGPENVNEIMRQTVKSLNIKLIVALPYHPQSNAKVERFHLFLGDTLPKLTDGEKENWDFPYPGFGTIRFSINEVIRFSSHFLLFGQYVMLPIDYLLKPRRKYVGEDFHRIILQHPHKIFMQAKQRIKRTQKKRNKRINKD